MKRITTLIVNLSYMQKLFLSSILLICIPFILYISVTSYLTSSTANSKAINEYRKSITQTASFIEYKANSIKNIIDAISADNTIGTLINKDPAYYNGLDSTGNWTADNGKIMNILYNSYSNEDINQVYLYMYNGLTSLQETEQIKSLISAQNTDWYNTLVEKSINYQWFPSSFFKGQLSSNTLSFVRKIANRQNVNQLLGILKADVPTSIFEEVLNQSLFTDATIAVLINSDNQVIAHSSNKLTLNTVDISKLIESFKYTGIDAKLKEVEYHKSQYLMGVHSIDKTDWMLAVMVPRSDITSITTQTRNYMLLIFMIILPITIAFSYLMAKYSTKRIRNLIFQMKMVEEGDFNIKVLPSSNDEIGQLTKNFNHMVLKTSMLMDEKFKLGKEKKAFELEALQAQIKPHFLYNTLDMINWMAMQNDVPEIAKLVKTLASFYKLSLSNGKEIVTIENEINHIRAYVEIQNMRFENSIKLIIDVPEEMLNYKIFKLTLQPIVENSIIHGILEKQEEAGTITITGKLSDKVVLTIEDDGVGMTEEEIAKAFLEKSTDKSSGYGIKNINERFKLNYGNEYGLAFNSEKGKGTKVDIIVPIVM